MFVHNYPIDLSDYVKYEDIVDNLVTNVTNKALSANQGIVLKGMIDAKATPVSMSVVGNNVELIMDNGDKVVMDATSLLLDIKSMSGRYDEPTQSIVITLSDDNSFSIPVASLLPVETDDTIDGNGSAIPLSVTPSIDADNILVKGQDGKLYVPKQIPSDSPNNGIILVDDRMYLEVLNENDLHSESVTAVPNQASVKIYVDNKFTIRKFIPKSSVSVSGCPSTSDITSKIGSFKNGVMYYTGTDNKDDEAICSWYIDREGVATALGSSISTNGNTTLDFMLGMIVHAIPDDGKSIFEINGQSISRSKHGVEELAQYLLNNPINGFIVGDTYIQLPDWRGDYIGATGAKGISDNPGEYLPSINKKHRHGITQSFSTSNNGYSYEAGSSNNGIGSYTEYDGATYARPETRGMPLCIVGGIKINAVVPEDSVTIVQNIDNPKDNELLSTSGISTLIRKPNKIYEYTFSASKTFTNGNAEVITSTPTYTIQKNKGVKIRIRVPVRNDASDWGGVYINTNIKVNGIWYNLGNDGYTSVMGNSANLIDVWYREFILNIPKYLSIQDSYTLKIELYARSYSGVVYINKNHDINRTTNNLGIRGDVVSWAINKNYTAIVVEEVESDYITD